MAYDDSEFGAQRGRGYGSVQEASDQQTPAPETPAPTPQVEPAKKEPSAPVEVEAPKTFMQESIEAGRIPGWKQPKEFSQQEVQNWIDWQSAQPTEVLFSAAGASQFPTWGEYYKSSGFSQADLENLARNALGQAAFKQAYGVQEGQPWTDPNWREVTAQKMAERERQRLQSQIADTLYGTVAGPGPTPPEPGSKETFNAAYDLVSSVDPRLLLRAVNIFANPQQAGVDKEATQIYQQLRSFGMSDNVLADIIQRFALGLKKTSGSSSLGSVLGAPSARIPTSRLAAALKV